MNKKLTAVVIAVALLLMTQLAVQAGTDGGSTELSEAEKIDRGLQVWGWFGGWEPDYTTKAREIMVGYKDIEPVHLFAGYGYSDGVFYDKSKVYAKGYYFYEGFSYAKLAVSMKDYEYPEDPDVGRPNPDSSSYNKVPAIEFEVSHWLNPQLRGTVFAEYFKPEFFYDTDSTANNFKVGGDVYYITPLNYLRAKLIVAVLKDPDSDKTEIKGRDNVNTKDGVADETEVVYKTSFMAGGALEYVRDKWEAELKVLPNRDLDSSYKYSILTKLQYAFTDKFSGRVDFLHDKYSSDSSFSGNTAQVYMVSGRYDVNQMVRVGAGYKHIVTPDKTEDTGFVTLRVKTGVLF